MVKAGPHSLSNLCWVLSRRRQKSYRRDSQVLLYDRRFLSLCSLTNRERELSLDWRETRSFSPSDYTSPPPTWTWNIPRKIFWMKTFCHTSHNNLHPSPPSREPKITPVSYGNKHVIITWSVLVVGGSKNKTFPVPRGIFVVVQTELVTECERDVGSISALMRISNLKRCWKGKHRKWDSSHCVVGSLMILKPTLIGRFHSRSFDLSRKITGVTNKINEGALLFESPSETVTARQHAPHPGSWNPSSKKKKPSLIWLFTPVLLIYWLLLGVGPSCKTNIDISSPHMKQTSL